MRFKPSDLWSKFFYLTCFMISLCYIQYKLYFFIKDKSSFMISDVQNKNYLLIGKSVKTALHKFKLNLPYSDSILLDRFIPDHRNPRCQAKKYPSNLSSVSIIIVFHNEPWSILIRTLKSLINRSPNDLLKEILLIDDHSTTNSIKYNLKSYLLETIKDPRIKLVRTASRIGLIKGRNYGASIASADVIIFLDSHVEVTSGWLPPLVSRIIDDPNRVVSPIVDLINPYDFSYNPVPDDFISGFTWKLTHFMIPLPKREKDRRKDDPTVPIKSPTTYGGLFAISRNLFLKLGGHDPDMSYLSFESIDLSLWVWCCGGNIEIVPCSRVGHVHHGVSYKFPGQSMSGVHLYNIGRVVELWLARYKMFYYLMFPTTATIDRGDLTRRRSHQRALGCRNFTWYLNNVYPETGFPLFYRSIGQIEHTPSMLCFDLRSTGKMQHESVILKPCRLNHGPDSSYYVQIFIYTQNGNIRCDNWCITAGAGADSGSGRLTGLTKQSNNSQYITLNVCDYSDSQIWIYSARKRHIRLKSTNLCIHLSGDSEKLITTQCDDSLMEQKFFMRDNFDWDEGTRVS